MSNAQNPSSLNVITPDEIESTIETPFVADFNPLAEATQEFRSLEENTDKRKAQTRKQMQEEFQAPAKQDLPGQDEAPQPAEASNDEPSDTPKEDEDLAYTKHVARLARREAQMRQQEQRLNEQRRYQEEQQKRLEHLLRVAEDLERDPASVVEKLGVDPEKLYMSELERQRAQEADRVARIERKIEEQERIIQEQRQQFELRQKTQRWESDFKSVFDKDEYALVKAWDPQGNLVRDLVADRMRSTGRLMRPESAMEILRDQITDRIKQLGFDPTTRGAKAAEAAPAPRTRQKPQTVPTDRGGASGRYQLQTLDDNADMERIVNKYRGISA